MDRVQELRMVASWLENQIQASKAALALLLNLISELENKEKNT